MAEVAALTLLGCLSTLMGMQAYTSWQGQRARRRTAALMGSKPRDPSTVEAQERALLWRVLSADQRESVRTRGYVDVTAASGQRYRLFCRAYHSAQELGPSGEAVASLCIMQCQQTSPAGQLLAELLLLRTNEAAFRRIARRSALRGFSGALL